VLKFYSLTRLYFYGLSGVSRKIIRKRFFESVMLYFLSASFVHVKISSHSRIFCVISDRLEHVDLLVVVVAALIAWFAGGPCLVVAK